MDNRLDLFKIIFYSDFWPEVFFINGYPLIGVLWNIFLLSIPVFLLIFLKKIYKKNKFKSFFEKILAFFVFFLWLIFMPNSAYLITDVRHLLDYCPVDSSYRVCSENSWMILFFFIYASVGWISFVYFLEQMRFFLIKVFNKKIEFFFIFTIIPLVSLGVLLGLLMRRNSWDLFIRPLEVLKELLLFFTNGIYFFNFIFFTISFFVLYFVGRKIFKTNF